MNRTERPRLSPMKRVDLWRWRFFDPVCQEWATTRFVMSEADAKLEFPDGAEKVEGSLKSSWVPDDEASDTAVAAPVDRIGDTNVAVLKVRLRQSVGTLLGCANLHSEWAREQSELNASDVIALLESSQQRQARMPLA